MAQPLHQPLSNLSVNHIVLHKKHLHPKRLFHRQQERRPLSWRQRARRPSSWRQRARRPSSFFQFVPIRFHHLHHRQRVCRQRLDMLISPVPSIALPSILPISRYHRHHCRRGSCAPVPNNRSWGGRPFFDRGERVGHHRRHRIAPLASPLTRHVRQPYSRHQRKRLLRQSIQIPTLSPSPPPFPSPSLSLLIVSRRQQLR